MSDNRPPGPPPPDSIQKGLLQLLWTTRPWIRNTVLVVVGLIAFVVAVVPQGVREDLLRKAFHIGAPDKEDPANPDLSEQNSHTYRLKNGHVVRLVARIVANGSNVADALLVNAIEADAWKYNFYCYDAHYGSLNTSMPTGTVTVEFDVLDQLPQHAKVGGNDFDSPTMGDCVVGVVAGQTVNEAGPNGSGHVAYAFRFVPT